MKRILTACLLVFALTVCTLTPAAASNPYDSAAPSGIVAAGDGAYLVTDTFNKVIWKLDADGTATLYAGRINISDVSGEPVGAVSDGALLSALFENPWGIAPFLDGYVISEPDSNVIRYIDETSVRTAAGSGEEGALNGVGTTATFSFPTGLAAGDNGEVYIADTGNGAIRRLDPNGTVTTVYTGLSDPTGLFWHNGTLYVAETGAHCISTIKDGQRTVIAGVENEDGYVEGYVKAAKLRDPQGVAVSNDGTVYIADTGNHAIRCLRGEQLSTLASGDHIMMPRGLTVAGEALLATDPFSRSVLTLSTAQAKFNDVADGTWYATAAYEAARRGLLKGVGDGRFDPTGATNRAMLAQMLVNLQQQLDRDLILAGSAALDDVPTGKWYSDSVCWAVDRGYMDAENATFAPLRCITREEMIVTLFRFAESLGVATSQRTDLSAFRDADSISDGAQDAVSWAIATGLIRGVGDSEISPDTTTTRAQMAQVMIRFMDLLQKNG